MTAEIIQAIGTHIVLPVCFFGCIAWAIYWNRNADDGDEE